LFLKLILAIKFCQRTQTSSLPCKVPHNKLIFGQGLVRKPI